MKSTLHNDDFRYRLQTDLEEQLPFLIGYANKIKDAVNIAKNYQKKKPYHVIEMVKQLGATHNKTIRWRFTGSQFKAIKVKRNDWSEPLFGESHSKNNPTPTQETK